MLLSHSHRHVLRALGDTLLPSTGEDDPGGGDLVPDGVEEILSTMTAADVRRAGVLLTMFDLAAMPRFGRRFSGLDPARRERYLAGWMTSRIALRRIVYRTLRGLCMNAYYQSPRAWPALKYDGPLVSRDRRPAPDGDASRDATRDHGGAP
jgi:hypothetical protein